MTKFDPRPSLRDLPFIEGIKGMSGAPTCIVSPSSRKHGIAYMGADTRPTRRRSRHSSQIPRVMPWTAHPRMGRNEAERNGQPNRDAKRPGEGRQCLRDQSQRWWKS
jgi:hypothetical protein